MSCANTGNIPTQVRLLERASYEYNISELFSGFCRRVFELFALRVCYGALTDS